jgi:hypothetical protein
MYINLEHVNWLYLALAFISYKEALALCIPKFIMKNFDRHLHSEVWAL